MNRTYHQQLLAEAQNGNAESLGTLLENYRAYLTVLAQRYLDPRLSGRLDPADVVQITFLEAQRDLASFRGHQIEELLGWLRNILRNNVSSAHQRHLFTQKRSAGREVSNSPTDSRPAITDLAPSETTSPSQRLMRDEAAVYLANCLGGLASHAARSVAFAVRRRILIEADGGIDEQERNGSRRFAQARLANAAREDDY